MCVFLNVHVCSMTGQTEINKAAPCSQFNVRVVEGRAAAQVGSYSYKQEYITPPRVCNSAYGVSDGENSHHVSQICSYYVHTKDSVRAIRISAMIMLGMCIPAVSFCQRVLFLLLCCSLKTGWKRTTATLHHVM